jgi:RNA polymerase sigma-70 factor (ECF subfamily)
MSPTSSTLLQRLRDPQDAAAWDQLVELYTPLLRSWALRMNCRGEEVADLLQEVFVKLLDKLPAFTYDRSAGSFRAWLRTVCRNCWLDYLRRPANQVRQADEAQLAKLATADDRLQDFWECEHRAFLVGEALKSLESALEPCMWQGLRKVLLDGGSVKEVAQELGITENALSICKCRALKQLRQDLAGLEDW